MAGGSSSLLRHSGVWLGLAATALVLAPAGIATTPKPEPTPEAKSAPQPEPAPSAGKPSTPSTSRPVRVTPRWTAPRTPVRITNPFPSEPRRSTRVRKAAAQTAVPRRRPPARSRRGAPPAAKPKPVAVFNWRAPLNPPLQFTSVPVAFADEPGAVSLLAALALLVLLTASASHLGLIYAVWKRVPG
jgi:hypothetical protein